MAEEKRKGGRKKIYHYKPEYASILIEEMGKGFGFKAAAAKLGIPGYIAFNWLNPERRDYEPEWVEAKEIGEMKALRYYEDMGLQLINGQLPKGSAAAWIFSMKNKFDWKDRSGVEMTGKDGAPVELGISGLAGLIRLAEKIPEKKKPGRKPKEK